MMRARVTQFVILVLCLLLAVYLVLALAQAGSTNSCRWAFPKWFGCVLSAHKPLSGVLIGVAGVLIGAWIAWTAVQQQNRAEHERLIDECKEYEQLLKRDLNDYADGGSSVADPSSSSGTSNRGTK